jgi:hypothetical protein
MDLADEIDPQLIGWTLFVAPHNYSALSLYASLGFDVCQVAQGLSWRMQKLRSA